MDRGWSDDPMESQVLTPPQVEGRWALSVKRDKFRNVFFLPIFKMWKCWSS